MKYISCKFRDNSYTNIFSPRRLMSCSRSVAHLRSRWPKSERERNNSLLNFSVLETKQTWLLSIVYITKLNTLADHV